MKFFPNPLPLQKHLPMHLKKIIIALFLLLPSLSFSQVVFSDIAGIVYNRCGSCHHAGTHATSFKNIVKVPAGYKLYGKHTYDNTTNNPYNPHNPPINVFAGFGTSDEMFFDSFQYLNYLPGDETISIDSILSLDPLLTGVDEPNVSLFKETIYPNPASENVTFSFINSNNSEVIIRMYDVNGKLINQANTGISNKGLHEYSWTIPANCKSGLYIYEISNNLSSSRGKLIISK